MAYGFFHEFKRTLYPTLPKERVRGDLILDKRHGPLRYIEFPLVCTDQEPWRRRPQLAANSKWRNLNWRWPCSCVLVFPWLDLQLKTPYLGYSLKGIGMALRPDPLSRSLEFTDIIQYAAHPNAASKGPQ